MKKDDKRIIKGLQGVIAGSTCLSDVNGESGKLIYCGYSISELISCSYEEICYLFLYGKLPNCNELNGITEQFKSYREVSKEILNFIRKKSQVNSPMSVLMSAVSMLNLNNIAYKDKTDLMNSSICLISRIATITASICRAKKGLDFIPNNFELCHVENFLYTSQGIMPDKFSIETLNTALVLHADHGFNASTFTCRVVASTLSDLISAIVAAIGALSGQLHGGANTAVMQMLLEIKSIDNVNDWLNDKLLNKEKIMGFGHRIYKTIDPRAIYLKRLSKIFGERTCNSKWFDISEKIEVLMKAKKGLYPNVDFYSASTYYYMGIDHEVFTIIFAMARIIGWISHYIEQINNNRIIRPESLYEGLNNRIYKSLDSRI